MIRTILSIVEMITFTIITKVCIFYGPCPTLFPLTGEGAEGGWGNARNENYANKITQFKCYYSFKRSFLTFLKSLTLFIILTSVTAYAEKAETAHRESVVFQTRLFEQLLERSNAFLEDSVLDTYLNGIIKKLSSASATDTQAIRVRVVKTSQFNAFAAPHGSIYLCSGLLSRIENEAQLAALLAHEMTHIINDHTCRNLINAKRKALSSANLAFGLELLTGSLASSISNLTLKAAITGYSRDLEREADSAGLVRMKQSGYPAVAFRNLFMILKTWIERYNIEEPYFFATHPAIQERIDNFYQFSTANTLDDTTDQYSTREFDRYVHSVLLFDGTLKIAAGDLAAAEEDFSRVLSIDSASAEALCNLGTITRLRSDEFSSHVVKWYSRSMKASAISESSRACAELGMYYYKFGITDSAAIYLHQFKTGNTTSPYLPVIEDYLTKCKK
ncbi:MAG TPA: M48 family metallopeptidase [Chitinispirillaceae bacterium]|nr:M48 family metallopeptidase [Chitinispirillaceae bacterium]